MENEEVKHLDYQGLSLYDQNIKEWATTKDEEIKINQVNGKSNSKTILVTPGSTTPATYYTASEAEAYNIEHGLQEGDPDYKHEGDLKTPASTTNTNIEVNIDNSTIVQDGTSGQLKVSSTALTKYIGDKDGENKYAINVSPTADSNNNKTISLDINSESNAIEKTTSGVKVKLGINKFNNPSIFGDNVREAYALSANDVVITGNNNEQVIKIYKDSALLDIKLLHAVPATYYTAEEAAEYNTEHELSPGDPDYKSEGDLKTSAIKPVYTKLNGWIDIEASLRTEENLALCFAYENVNGEIVVEAIQVGSFLRETEFKEGLQVVDGEVSVKLSSEKVRIAATPEGVTPGSEQDTGLVEVATLNLSNGVQINHIQDAINYAINTFVPDTYTKEELDESEEVIARALNDLNTRIDNKADASVFGASGENHSTGLVPDPGDVAGTTKFLREDGTWAIPVSDNSDTERVISEALNDLDCRILFNEASNDTKFNELSQIIDNHISDTKLIVETLNRRTPKSFTNTNNSFLNLLKQAVADQNLEKYGLKVGDYSVINGHTYVIAGLNPMKGTVTPYRLTQNHVGLIVIPHTTQAWNASGNTSTGADGRGAGYKNSDLHYYLTNTILPLVETDLGASNLLGHSKLLTNAVNTTAVNRMANDSSKGASSGWEWVADCKICALSEVQVYGATVWSSSGHDTGEACRQLDVFRVYNHTEIFGSEYPWLRDVASASRACRVSNNGGADVGAASDAYCVAGLILFN